MVLCRMREIVPAWLPQQPISELLTSVPTTQPAAENHSGPLQAAWGPAKPGGKLCDHVGGGKTWLLELRNTTGRGRRKLVWAWAPCWLGTEPAPFAFGWALSPELPNTRQTTCLFFPLPPPSSTETYCFLALTCLVKLDKLGKVVFHSGIMSIVAFILWPLQLTQSSPCRALKLAVPWAFARYITAPNSQAPTVLHNLIARLGERRNLPVHLPDSNCWLFPLHVGSAEELQGPKSGLWRGQHYLSRRRACSRGKLWEPRERVSSACCMQRKKTRQAAGHFLVLPRLAPLPSPFGFPADSTMELIESAQHSFLQTLVGSAYPAHCHTPI